MPEFTYQARDGAGQSVTGTISARDTTEAAMRVRALGVYPTRVAPANGKDRETAQNGKNGTETVTRTNEKVPRMQVLLFTREMSDMLDAGMPIDRALSVLIEQMEQEGMRNLLTAAQKEVRAGQPLSEALRKYPRQFPSLYVNMIRAGEVSGQLPDVMTRLADFMEKEQTRRSQIMAALTYPMVLMVVAVSAVTFLLTFVVPKLSGIFHDMGNSLPLPTKILLLISGFVGKYWLEILIALAAAVGGTRFWVRTKRGADSLDRTRMKLPVLGPVIQKVVAARLVRTLGTLLAGGVPILESLDIASSALGSSTAAAAMQVVRNSVRQGEMLHTAMEKTDTFLPVVLHMTAVGEETGRLPAMLLRTADTLDFEVDNAMRRLTSLIEPLVVLFMGGFIGFVVLSILLPIFQANNLVTH